ncbi:reticulon-like protein B8 [Camellia sinensis]|uniref:reticulon-like protein B8 n=1 Tax=Camellia sinensis TaxID=4442 RepID=UPI00103609F1|nr:reticulon-like protein B8 [Camellia sinensis]
MSEEITADSVSKQQPVDNSQKLILNLLGSGKSADGLLWSNKTISTDVLAAITVIWSPSEPPHLVLPDELFVNIAKSVGVVINLAFGSFQDVACRGNIKQFLGLEVALPNMQCFHDVKISMLRIYYYKSVIFACNFMEVTELTLGKSLLVVASLWAAAVIARWCNFLTVLYIGFVASHTLPVLYERNKDQVDSFVYNVLSKISKGNKHT